MSNSNVPAKTPSMQELALSPEEAFKNDLVNSKFYKAPPADWLNNHPTASRKDAMGKIVPIKYLPIDKVEYLLTYFFQRWHVEILREGQLFQSIYVTVRLHYYDTVNGEWRYQDGVGAVPVQTEKGKAASDLAAIKSAAVQMGLPAAESYAIKDAAEKIGPIFGKDINRDYTVEFKGMYSDEDLLRQQAEEIKKAMQTAANTQVK